MEKRTPHHDLKGFQVEFVAEQALRLTQTAIDCVKALGLSLADVVIIVQSMNRKMFFKSMTTYADHKAWQDVYHVPFQALVLYVKLMIDDRGRLIVSLKAKE
jgi:motility quorum-sensing regulator/GCU-specific mRNA interferase toxin